MCRTLAFLCVTSLAALLPFASVGCGGGGKAKDDDGDVLTGSPVFLNRPILWIDVDDSSLLDVGDVLVFSFDRPVVQGANAPAADLVLTNGTLVGAAWANGFMGDETKMTLTVGAGDVLTAGKLAGGTTFNMSGSNTIQNAEDGTVGATPAGGSPSAVGRIADTLQNLAGGVGFCVEMLDIDGDGDRDVVVGTTGKNLLFTNTGTNSGVFAAAAPIVGEVSAITAGIGVGNVDADALPDFVAANTNVPNGNRVYLQTAPGTYTTTNTPGRDLIGTSNSNGVVVTSNAFVSWDGVGGGEIFVANNGVNRVYYADAAGQVNGDGTLGGGIPGPQDIPGAADTRAVAIGDLDGNGVQDVVTVDDNGGAPGTVTVYLVTPGAGAQATFAATALPGALFSPRDVALCDVDGDTDLDIVVGYAGTGLGSTGMQVFLQAGVATGMFSLTNTILGGDVQALACTDVDGDGFDDVVQGRGGGQGIAVFLNCGGGAFLNAQIGIAGTVQALAQTGSQSFGEPPTGFDGMGRGDVVSCEVLGQNRVFVSAK